MFDAGERAGVVGAYFDIDLVRLELDYRLAGLDAVAFFLEPARHARFDDRFTQLWNDDVGHDGRLCLFGEDHGWLIDLAAAIEDLLHEHVLVDMVPGR